MVAGQGAPRAGLPGGSVLGSQAQSVEKNLRLEMVQVKLTLTLPDWWGADYAFASGGAKAVRELIEEDLRAFADDASWEIEQREAETA